MSGAVFYCLGVLTGVLGTYLFSLGLMAWHELRRARRFRSRLFR